MHILLLGQNSSITDTIEDMINYKEGWSVTKISSYEKGDPLPKSSLDVIALNLVDFSAPSPLLIQSVKRQSSAPVLALHTYQQEPLIRPLINAGATGYLQLGASDKKIHEAVEKVANLQEHISLM